MANVSYSGHYSPTKPELQAKRELAKRCCNRVAFPMGTCNGGI